MSNSSSVTLGTVCSLCKNIPSSLSFELILVFYQEYFNFVHCSLQHSAKGWHVLNPLCCRKSKTEKDKNIRRNGLGGVSSSSATTTPSRCSILFNPTSWLHLWNLRYDITFWHENAKSLGHVFVTYITWWMFLQGRAAQHCPKASIINWAAFQWRCRSRSSILVWTSWPFFCPWDSWSGRREGRWWPCIFCTAPGEFWHDATLLTYPKES